MSRPIQGEPDPTQRIPTAWEHASKIFDALDFGRQIDPNSPVAPPTPHTKRLGEFVVKPRGSTAHSYPKEDMGAIEVARRRGELAE